MRNRYSLPAILFLLCHLFAPRSASAQEIRILYFSSAPEVIRDGGQPGLAHVSAVVRKERETSDNVFFIHGGASLGPSVLGALDSGAHMIDILNLMEPDLMAVGKREFSYKEDQFSLHALSAGFPFISSNLVNASDRSPVDGVEATTMLEAEGIAVGIIALTSANAILQYAANSLIALDTDTVIRSEATKLRLEGADAIIILADTDFNDLSPYIADETVEAVLYAHNFDNQYSADVKGVTIEEGPLDGKLIALNLRKTDSAAAPIIQGTLETIDLHKVTKDPAVEGIIKSYASRLEALLQQEIGVNQSLFDTIRQNVRTQENPFGNLVADAIRSEMKADVALVNSGGIRGNRTYNPGHILTREDIQLELPFNNTVELFEVSGKQLLDALEWGIGCMDEVDGCFLQVSNLKVGYSPSTEKGRRINSLSIAGTPLDINKTYKLATLNFLAEGGDGFTMLQNSQRLSRPGSGKLLWEVVVSYLQSLETIAPTIEGRIFISE